MGLILTRKVGQVLTIGDNVTVRILGVKGSQVRIDVCAPKDVAVHREEIADKCRDGTGHVGHKIAGIKP